MYWEPSALYGLRQTFLIPFQQFNWLRVRLNTYTYVYIKKEKCSMMEEFVLTSFKRESKYQHGKECFYFLPIPWAPTPSAALSACIYLNLKLKRDLTGLIFMTLLSLIHILFSMNFFSWFSGNISSRINRVGEKTILTWQHERFPPAAKHTTGKTLCRHGFI